MFPTIAQKNGGNEAFLPAIFLILNVFTSASLRPVKPSSLGLHSIMCIVPDVFLL